MDLATPRQLKKPQGRWHTGGSVATSSGWDRVDLSSVTCCLFNFPTLHIFLSSIFLAKFCCLSLWALKDSNVPLMKALNASHTRHICAVPSFTEKVVVSVLLHTLLVQGSPKDHYAIIKFGVLNHPSFLPKLLTLEHDLIMPLSLFAGN